MLHRVPRSATVLAEEDCRLLSVAGDDLRAAVQSRGGMIGRLAAAPARAARPRIGFARRRAAGLDDATQPL